MADWTLVPEYPGEIDYGEPPTARTVYEDGGQQRRERFSTSKRSWKEKYTLTSAQVQTLLTHWETYRLATSFTRVTYDPQDAPATEATVYWSKRPKIRRLSVDTWTATVQHEEA